MSDLEREALAREDDPEWHKWNPNLVPTNSSQAMTAPRPEQPATAAGSYVSCGRCYHPMHWKVCGCDVLTTASCRCRNDGEAEAAAAALPDVEELAAALQRVRGEHLDIGPCTIEKADAAAILAEIERARGGSK